MRLEKTSLWNKNLVLVAVGTLCCILVAAILYTSNLPIALKTLAIVLVAVISAVPLLLYKSMVVQHLRLRRFQLLGRKLVHIKKEQKRDEKLALKILNHINSATHSGNASAPCETGIWQKPLHGFSGDLAMACDAPCGKKYTLLADLTGHGIAAAMGAAPVASIFRATAQRGLPVEEIVTELNNRLEQLLPSGFFCCATVIQNDQGKTTVCNAGLPEILIANNNGEIVDRVKSEQLPLGIQATEAQDVQVFTKTYATDHQLYAVTDGMIETVGANDAVFDIDVLSAIISQKPNGFGRIGNITECFETFAKGSEPTDDISIVEVKIC